VIKKKLKRTIPLGDPKVKPNQRIQLKPDSSSNSVLIEDA
jgi:hypothetical protein